MKSERIDEAAIAAAIEAYLRDAGGCAKIADIRKALPQYITLSPQDSAPSPTRPREQLWEQQVRNIVCHRNTQGNPINSGRLKWAQGALFLTNSPQGDLFD